MLILGFETSGPAASVGICEDGQLKAEYTLSNTRTHSETILPLAARLMEDLGLQPQDLSALAVNVGPGSFTGVRIGVCTANAMGMALGIPVIGIDALAALYQGLRVASGPVCVVIDARNANAYAALFENGACIRQPEAVALAEYLPQLPPDTLFAGDGALAYRKMIETLCFKPAFAPDDDALNRAGLVLSAAWGEMERMGKGGWPMAATPLYLRPSQAERMWQQREKNKGEGNV